MTDSKPAATSRLDYRPPAFLVDTVDLRFELDPDATLVHARLALRRNPAHGDPPAPLFLNGEALTLLGSGSTAARSAPTSTRSQRDGLTIPGLPDACTLEIETRIAPAANTELSGLYTSGGAYFTQCEAEGFRRITYFPDRPDVMARYSTTIVADPAHNECCCRTAIPAQRGDAGRRPPLRGLARSAPEAELPVRAGRRRPRCGPRPFHHPLRPPRRARHLGAPRRRGPLRPRHAGAQDSMDWDEDVFGLEYDLDVFNIAAVSDFNMGAMENKGLNLAGNRPAEPAQTFSHQQPGRVRLRRTIRATTRPCGPRAA